MNKCIFMGRLTRDPEIRYTQSEKPVAVINYTLAVDRRYKREAYDYCIIDNAPDINMSIINALVTSNDVIVPVFMDQYSFDGLDILMEQIAQVQEDFNENLHFAGCVITQYQNNDVNNQGIEWLKAHNVPVFNQWIRRTEKKVNESTFAKCRLWNIP